MTTGRGPVYAAGRLPAFILWFSIAVAAIEPFSAFASPSKPRLTSPAAQSVNAPAVFAADCTTPKTTFNLGDTVCVKATGVAGLRLQWVDADGFAVSTSNVTGDAVTESFVLPSTDQSIVSGVFTANNLGRWRVNATTSGNSVRSSVFFTVRDPNHPSVDLSVVKSSVGGTTPFAGDPVQFAVTIVNNGPDDAVNAHFIDNTFSNAIFNSLAQTSGPAFACIGGDCRIASLPNGAVATFVVNFTAGGAGGVLENTASISSDTPELNSKDNSSSSPPITVLTSGTPPTCRLVVTAPPSVTLFTGPGATACSFTVADLDATLGTGSATDNCTLVGGVARSGVPAGNTFPVGVTILTYSASDTDGNTASAIQQVTVVDNTAPTITCPPNMTLEATCPSGAVATWTAPTPSDNCSGATSQQTSGPAAGSVFPIGTTSVSYSASDTAGNHASCSFTVTVLSPAATIQNLESSVSASSLTGPQKQGLLPTLDAALNALNRGDSRAACQTLAAFTNQVRALISSGKLSAAQGQGWMDSAVHAGNAIGCTASPCS